MTPRTLMNRKNLLFIFTSPSGGGAERNAVSLVNLLAKNGYKVVVACTNNINNHYGIDNDIPLFLVSYEDTERYEKISTIVEKYSIDVVILSNHWLQTNLEDIKWFKSHNIKVIAQEHSMFFFPLYTGQYSLFSKRLEAYKTVDILTCLSQMDLELWKLSGVQQVRYVPNLMTKLPHKKTLNIKNFNQRDNAIVIVGRLSEIKGLYKLPLYLEKILKRDTTTSVWIFGNFSSRADKFYFFYDLKKRGISERVLWHPFSTDIFKYIENAKLLFIPSLIEGSPMVISEARQLGTPCVLFGLDYLDNAYDGVIHVSNLDELPKIIYSLMTNEKFWNKYSQKARENLETWDEQSVLSIWEKMFANLFCYPKNISSNARSCCNLNYNQILAIRELYNAIDFLENKKCTIKDCLNNFHSFINLLRVFREFLKTR